MFQCGIVIRKGAAFLPVWVNLCAACAACGGAYRVSHSASRAGLSGFHCFSHRISTGCTGSAAGCGKSAHDQLWGTRRGAKLRERRTQRCEMLRQPRCDGPGGKRERGESYREQIDIDRRSASPRPHGSPVLKFGNLAKENFISQLIFSNSAVSVFTAYLIFCYSAFA